MPGAPVEGTMFLKSVVYNSNEGENLTIERHSEENDRNLTRWHRKASLRLAVLLPYTVLFSFVIHTCMYVNIYL